MEIIQQLAPLHPLIKSILDTEEFKKPVETGYMLETERTFYTGSSLEGVREKGNEDNRENTRQQER